MKILVITNKVNEKINLSLLNIFGAVKTLANKCDVLVLGNKLSTIAEEIAKYKIVDKVITIDHPILQNILAENIANQLAEIIPHYTHVFIAANNFGKNLLPRVAGILEIGQISEVIKIISPNVYQKFIYAGNVLIEVESLEDIKLLTIRTSSFDIYDEGGGLATIQNIEYTNQISKQVKFIAEDTEEKAVDLTNAQLVISGGRSLGSKEAFDLHIRELAKRLSAGVGATRAAVEAGFASNDCQVGQTGKVVAPNLYLAFGVSGAVQHIAGMKNSKTVVAVNTDHTAPIFEYSDYGLVDDLFKVIPELLTKISK
ncbi:MAG: electron transfer flavoprotein subunit alpha/FixB family protein [Neisseriaceae bacterium]